MPFYDQAYPPRYLLVCTRNINIPSESDRVCVHVHVQSVRVCVGIRESGEGADGQCPGLRGDGESHRLSM